MASISSSSSPLPRDRRRLDLDSIRALVLSVEQHILTLLSDAKAWKSLKLKCTSCLKIQKQEFFEFSEQSVQSNLYWGIENVEIAIRAKCPEEKSAHLKSSEQMLQIPALLNEHGRTGGVSNRYLICCAYFYLSLVQYLQRDEWQMTLHFLQALLVSPWDVRTDFAPKIWEGLFLSHIMGEHQEMGCRGKSTFRSIVEFGEVAIDEATRQLARRYKDWMMYYQVVLYGETPRWIHGDGDAPTPTHFEESSDSVSKMSACTANLDSVEQENALPILHDADSVHPLDLEENIKQELTASTNSSILNTEEENEYAELGDCTSLHTKSKRVFRWDIKESSHIKCLQDMLKDSQSDMSISIYSIEGSDSEEKMHNCGISVKTPEKNAGVLASEIGDGKMLTHCSISPPECGIIYSPEAFGCSMHEEAYELNCSSFFSRRSHSSDNDLNLSILELKDTDLCSFQDCYVEDDAKMRRFPSDNFRCFKHIPSTLDHQGSFARKELDFSNSEKNMSEVSLHIENNSYIEILGKFERAVSALCFSEGLKKCEDSCLELSTLWEILKNTTGTKYNLLKEVILSELLDVISTSKEVKVVRALVAVLLVLISENGSLIEDIKRKNSHLYDLANALKQNVHEAAILIYLLSPSLTEIKALDILPALVEVACKSKSYKDVPLSFPLKPTTASIMMIEALVTKCDYATNNMHLATITSPEIFSRLTNARYINLEEVASWVTILVSCMRFDGNCRNYLSQVTPVSAFLHLLTSNERQAKFAALEFFHEILRVPRSSATCLLLQIRQLGNINIMHTLMTCIQQSEPEYQLLAANLLLQLDMMENTHGRSIFREEAMEVLLESLASEGSPSAQALSAFILSNLGGTYAWTGEPYTVAWLLKKTGLTSSCHQNMIRNFDWSDPSLQDSTTDACCSKIARSIVKMGNSVFLALEKGLKSNTRTVSRDCLTAIAWLGCELAVMDPSNLRYIGCEILLGGIMRFLHPGLELDERLLACLCLYNYASGKGMKNLLNVSEGLRESLRRLSSITWMAEELLKVTDYILPTQSHVSCAHTQVLEAGHIGTGAVSALIFYKGQLYSGYSNGSIKVWAIKGQAATLVWEVKEHKKEVTCFAIFEPSNSLLSGSADKTVRVWQMVWKKLECVEVIEMKEVIHNIDTHGQLIFVVTQSHGLKVCNAMRTTRNICRSKHVKCIAVAQGKIYIGCTDSSIQEVDIMTDEMREIKVPAKSWWTQKRPINSIIVYKDWIYSASDIVEGSNLKEWRKGNRAQVSTAMVRRSDVLALEVAEDFMYLSCSSSPTILQIWLREKHQKLGRLSAGSRITSLLTANDIVLCGTETGLIKGWIPF